MNEEKVKKPMAKKIKIIIGLVIAVVLIGSGIGIFYYNKNTGKITDIVTQKSMGANLELVQGSVLVKSKDAQKFQEAQSGDSVYKDYSIKTGADSKAVVVFDTGDVIRLGDNTEVKILELTDKKVQVDNLGGDVYSRVDHIDGKTFEILVKNYPAVAVGTAYSTKYNTIEKNAEYKVLDSTIKVGKEAKSIEAGKKAILNTESGDIEIKDMEKGDIEDGFIAWNKDEDEKAGLTLSGVTVINDKEKQKEEEVKKHQEEQNQEQNENTYLWLSAWATENGVALNWEVSGLDIPSGFKVIKSGPNDTPVYPGSAYQYLSDSANRYYEWGLTNGETYNFRVCTYNGNGGCLAYSNIVQVTAPKKESSSGGSTGSVSSIGLSGSAIGSGKVNLGWSVTGNSSKGFKVVWGKNSGPTYPCRVGDSYHYLSSPSATSDQVTGLEVGQTYYFRVCEYLGGACGVYSNEISIVAN